jgi:hypothetical protein
MIATNRRLFGLLTGVGVGLVALSAAAIATPALFGGGLGVMFDLTKPLAYSYDNVVTFSPQLPDGTPTGPTQTLNGVRIEQQLQPNGDGTLTLTLTCTGLTRSSLFAASLFISKDIDGDGLALGPLESGVVVDVATFENGKVKFRSAKPGQLPAPLPNPVESVQNPPVPGCNGVSERLPVAVLSTVLPPNTCAVGVKVINRDLNHCTSAVSLP